jgi:hypothetical protein
MKSEVKGTVTLKWLENTDILDANKERKKERSKGFEQLRAPMVVGNS